MTSTQYIGAKIWENDNNTKYKIIWEGMNKEQKCIRLVV